MLSAICIEDLWTWNPLLCGNHLGSIQTLISEAARFFA